MSVLLLFISTGGNTRKVAKRIQRQLEVKENQVETIDLGKLDPYKWKSTLAKGTKWCEVMGIGSPIFHMDFLSPITELLEAPLEDLQNKSSFLFLTYAGITSGMSLVNYAKIMQRNRISIAGALKLCAPHFYQEADFLTSKSEEMIDTFVHELCTKAFLPLDALELRNQFKPEKIRTRLIYPLAHSIGERRNLPMNVNDDKCIRCGKCVRECPVKAISIDDKVGFNELRCLHCYHCVVTCPLDAIDCDIGKLESMVRKNKKIMGMENPLSKMIV